MNEHAADIRLNKYFRFVERECHERTRRPLADAGQRFERFSIIFFMAVIAAHIG